MPISAPLALSKRARPVLSKLALDKNQDVIAALVRMHGSRCIYFLERQHVVIESPLDRLADEIRDVTHCKKRRRNPSTETS